MSIVSDYFTNISSVFISENWMKSTIKKKLIFNLNNTIINLKKYLRIKG